MERFTLDKKILKFLLIHFDPYVTAENPDYITSMDMDTMRKVIDASLLLQAYLNQSSQDGRASHFTWDTTDQLAEHVCAKLAGKVDPRKVGLSDRARITAVIERYTNEH